MVIRDDERTRAFRPRPPVMSDTVLGPLGDEYWWEDGRRHHARPARYILHCGLKNDSCAFRCGFQGGMRDNCQWMRLPTSGGGAVHSNVVYQFEFEMGPGRSD